jgi:hypothetical protein
VNTPAQLTALAPFPLRIPLQCLKPGAVSTRHREPGKSRSASYAFRRRADQLKARNF